MLLEEVLRHYLLEHDLSPESEKQLRIPCRLLVQWLGYEPEVGRLSVETVNQFLRYRRTQVSRTTVANNAAVLRRLLRYAARHGWCRLPKGLRRVRPRPSMPRAWTLEEVRRLLTACRKVLGTLPNGVPCSLYFSCFLLVTWDTGMRPCDVKTLSLEEVDSQGRVYRSQKKTGYAILGQLSPTAREWFWQIAQIVQPHPHPLCWPLKKTRWHDYWREIRKQAGLKGPGVLKRIRKSAASYVERLSPGSAQKFLGHRTPGLAYRHYVDPRIAWEEPVRPPELLPKINGQTKDLPD